MTLQTLESDSLDEISHAVRSLRLLGWEILQSNDVEGGMFVITLIRPNPPGQTPPNLRHG